jgi:hypothetical protein
MPFGKYKGVPLRHLPDDYLCWLRDLPDLRGPLRMRVEREYQRRIRPRDRARVPAARAGALAPARLASALTIIARGFRIAAHDVHPDHRGGSHEAMLALQEAKAALERLVKEAV